MWIVEFTHIMSSLGIPLSPEQDNSDTRTKVWYFDTPDYSRPIHRRNALSIYPPNISSLISREMLPPSMIDTNAYQKISEFHRMFINGTITTSYFIRSIVDRWIQIELVIRSSLDNNPELSSRMTGPIPKYMLITMGGFLGALFSRQSISKWTRILVPTLGVASTFSFCYPNTSHEIIKGIISIFSPSMIKEKYSKARDVMNEWQAEQYYKLKNKLYNLLKSKNNVNDD